MKTRNDLNIISSTFSNTEKNGCVIFGTRASIMNAIEQGKLML